MLAATAEEKVKLGDKLLKQGYASDALLFYDQAVDLNQYYWPAYLNRGKALLQLGQKRFALDDFKKVLQLNPDSAEARHYLTGANNRPKTPKNIPSKTKIKGLSSKNQVHNQAAQSHAKTK